jgi:hypothetical protein
VTGVVTSATARLSRSDGVHVAGRGVDEPDVGFPVLAHVAFAVDVEGRQAGRNAAFADQTVVKATLMRITLHAVQAEDYPAFHNAAAHVGQHLAGLPPTAAG